MFVFVAIVVVVGGYFLLTKSVAIAPEATTNEPVSTAVIQPTTPESEAPTTVAPVDASKVKEFTMTAYYDEKGKWYSLKEMTVKKGDTVRVNITNTKGLHNFNIDELGVVQNLPLNEKVVVEFTASKVGDFVYYCSMPGHRVGGQWGTLHVTN